MPHAKTGAAAASGQRPKAIHLPGETGIWIFIFGDMMVFALFFCTFAFYRAQDVALFQASQAQLNRNLGALNTLLLLTSSWFVAEAMQAVRNRRIKRAPLLFGAACFCACCFVVVKIFEYGEKIRAGITMGSNDFFMYYYAFTGIHLLHVTAGLVLLLRLSIRSRREPLDTTTLPLFESGASYWHMVDLLWVVLFPLLYLVK